MNYKTLLADAELRRLDDQLFHLASIPADGRHVLQKIIRTLPDSKAAFVTRSHIGESVTITDHETASGPWFSDRNIKLLVWDGNLVIEGDLIDNDWEHFPALVVTGDLSLRNWLRGGMSAFIGGSIDASGFIIGHYNDSFLFCGGDLRAAGYLPRVRRFPDFPEITSHQISGRIEARTLDIGASSSADLEAAFVSDALIREDDETYVDEGAIFERVATKQPVWR